MAEKRRYTVTVPDHISDAIERQANVLGATGTEYAADVLRWWFGQGCPPVTHDEAALRATVAEALASGRLRQVPTDLDAWNLDPDSGYKLVDEPVKKILAQLGIPNLFAHAAEHDKVQLIVVFDNHPTHWLWFRFFKGWDNPKDNGLAFEAFSKKSVGRKEMLKAFQREAKRIGSTKIPTEFSQLPSVTKLNTANPTTTKVTSTS